MILETFEKQPWDEKDYDVFYTDWMVEGDELASATATVECVTTPDEDPISLEAFEVDVSSSIVKVWLRGGTAGERYKVTLRVQTTNDPPRKDESEFIVSVKDT